MVCSIQNIFQEAEAFLPVFPWVSPKIHWKPEGMLPKNFCFIVICFLQLLIEPWKPHDRLHGIPGDDQKESRKTPLKGGRKSMQRERHPKFEITLIRKTRTNSSDFCLEIHFVFFKNRNYQFLKIKFTMWYTKPTDAHSSLLSRKCWQRMSDF